MTYILSAYDINVQDRPQFVYDTTSEYLLQIECDDGSNTATSTFTVNIEKNQVPYFTNTDCKWCKINLHTSVILIISDFWANQSTM